MGVTDWKKASDADRADIRKVRNAMVSDLHIGIERAIAIGEAKAKAVQERAIENINSEKKTLLTTIPWLSRTWLTTSSLPSRATMRRSLTTTCRSRHTLSLLLTTLRTTEEGQDQGSVLRR